MKYLILFSILLSCSNSEKFSKLESKNVFKVQKNSRSLDGNLDMFVAFYWPNKFETGESEIVRNIIQESRALIQIKENYYKFKFTLTCDFNALDCFCVVNRTCTEEPTEQRTKACQSLDEKLQTNDELLIDFSFSIFNIQESLERFTHKGHWIKTHSDYQRDDITLINHNAKTIYIPSWDKEDFDQTAPISISPQRIDFSFNTSKEIHVKAFADVKETKFYQQGIGEIEEYKKTKLLRKGVLFFESSNLSKLKCDQDTLE